VKISKYTRYVNYTDPHGGQHRVPLDVYSVLAAFDVRCPAVQHAVKKLLCSGVRGHKDKLTDLREAVSSLARALELAEEPDLTEPS